VVKPRKSELQPLAIGPREVAERIAYNIRAELVCCDAYDRWSGDSFAAEEAGQGLCYWGEAAARLAEYTAGLRPDES
jgi:hypothetical protein